MSSANNLHSLSAALSQFSWICGAHRHGLQQSPGRPRFGGFLGGLCWRTSPGTAALDHRCSCGRPFSLADSVAETCTTIPVKTVTGEIVKLIQKPIGPYILTVVTLARSWSVVGGAHIQAFIVFTALTLSRSRSVAWQAHIHAFRTKTYTRVGLFCPHCKKGAVGTSTRADACACAGDPQPRLFEFTSL